MKWINRTTVGISLGSLFSDISHELATAALPSVLLSIGAGPFSIGIIEGVADGVSAISKLWGGILADRVQKRKPLASIGYLVTAIGIATIGICVTWWQVMFARVLAWIGRGSRSAARDVLMTEGSPKESLGKAFGMERAGDAFGAVLGPLLALAFLWKGIEPRRLMIWSLLPGMVAFLCIAFLVVENLEATPPPTKRKTFSAHIKETSPRFQKYLIGIFVFGSGDFSRTMLILYATIHLRGTLFSLSTTAMAVGLYAFHNAVTALAALPIGFLVDHIGRKPVVVGGYIFAAATTLAFALFPPTIFILIVLFLCSGIYIACQEVSEKSFGAELLTKETMGTGMGLLAATNGIGDLVASALAGGLWALYPETPQIGFITAGFLQLVGAFLIKKT